MITELTKKQEAKLPYYRDLGLKKGLSCEPVDFNKSVKAINNLIEYVGEDPKQFEHVFVKSPKKGFGIYGSLESYWVYNYKFYEEILGPIKGLDILEQVIENCFFVTQEGNTLYHSDRPEYIKMENGLLHCEDGPSVRFRDGFSVYSWRGTRIPKKYIMEKGSIDPSEALTHENAEIRRCIAEIVGWDTILDLLENRVIDNDVDPQVGTLVEVDIPEIGIERFLRVLCGTGRNFAMPVPPETQTALEGQAFLRGFSLDEYKEILPEVRT